MRGHLFDFIRMLLFHGIVEMTRTLFTWRLVLLMATMTASLSTGVLSGVLRGDEGKELPLPTVKHLIDTHIHLYDQIGRTGFPGRLPTTKFCTSHICLPSFQVQNLQESLAS